MFGNTTVPSSCGVLDTPDTQVCPYVAGYLLQLKATTHKWQEGVAIMTAIRNPFLIDAWLIQIAVNSTRLHGSATNGDLVMAVVAHKHEAKVRRPFQSASKKAPISGLSPRSPTDMEGMFESSFKAQDLNVEHRVRGDGSSQV